MEAIYNRLRVRSIPPVPHEVRDAFEKGSATLIPFEDRCRALTDPDVRFENGLAEFNDGSCLVSVTCFLPGVTREMARWWAWWFPQDPERFRAWLPDSNIGFRYSEEDADYFTAERIPPFRPHTLYPVQAIGDLSLPFRIDAMHPKDFGFTSEVLAEVGDPFVFCARMKPRKGNFLYTDFYYAFFQEDDGVRFSGRFWMGRSRGNKFLRLIMINRHRAESLGISCYREYTALAGILPELYGLYGPRDQE